MCFFVATRLGVSVPGTLKSSGRSCRLLCSAVAAPWKRKRRSVGSRQPAWRLIDSWLPLYSSWPRHCCRIGACGSPGLAACRNLKLQPQLKFAVVEMARDTASSSSPAGDLLRQTVPQTAS